MRSRHIGIRRLAILTVIFVILAAVAAVKYFHDHPRQSPAKSEVAEADGPSRPRGNVIFLKANNAMCFYCYGGLISRELLRQAILIAARDQLGLETRDASLREWQANPLPQNSLELDLNDTAALLHDADSPPYKRWRHPFDLATWPTDLNASAEDNERRSREEFVNVLRKAGWSGTPNAWNAGAPVPEDAEAHLMEMEELGQFGVLRETHAAIRKGGESLPRLGALVRAYANLAQLTRYHWSLERAAYAARSLLYAQRMVAKSPDSALALWHRAYARAMAGLLGGALEDLRTAEKLKQPPAPAWLPLLEPFCKYQTETLVTLATANPKISGLGMYLALLSVEHSDSQGAIMSLAQSALALNPNCLRIIDKMCDETGPGMLNDLTERGPAVFSDLLPARLQSLPLFPKQLSDQIDGFRRPGGNPNGRQTICQELIDQGTPDKDSTEPSWAALGRLVQETTFAHIERQADLISRQWGVDASDYVNQVQPLIAGHPFKFVIDVYGIAHSSDAATLKRTLDESQPAAMASTLQQIHVYYLETWIQAHGPDSAKFYWGCINANFDCNSFDLEDQLNSSQGGENTDWGQRTLERLKQVSPESPVLVAANVRGHWSDADAVKWEADHGDYPCVALALGSKYTQRKRWADAERNLRRYISVSPDKVGYEDLAKIYEIQHKDDLWLATLNEYLNHGQDFGLQYAQVQSQIANYFMGKRDYKSAIPYADAAAQTASGWGLCCAAHAHTGIGDWATAEQLLIDDMNHYSSSPYLWYSWCVATGHGDLAAAKKAMGDYFTNKAKTLNGDDLYQLGLYQIAQGKYREALGTFQREMSIAPAAMAALYIAVIDDRLHDPGGSGAALDQCRNMLSPGEPYARLATLLGKAPSAIPDVAAIDAIARDASDEGRIKICAISALFFDNRGRNAEATQCLKAGAAISVDCSDDIGLIDSMLQQRGINPMTLEQTATRPTTPN
jgi:tetratricopeptide (TPR) repeat protein